MGDSKKSISKIDYNAVIAKARADHEAWVAQHPPVTGAQIRAKSDEWWRKQMIISEGLFADDDEQLLRSLGFTERSLAWFLGISRTTLDYILGRRR